MEKERWEVVDSAQKSEKVVYLSFLDLCSFCEAVANLIMISCFLFLGVTLIEIKFSEAALQ